jgi:hypothetical protein
MTEMPVAFAAIDQNLPWRQRILIFSKDTE